MAQNNKSDQTFRDGWTQQQLDPLSKANPGKNIMIICVKHDAHCLQGVQNQTLECQCPSGSKLNYTVYIFDEGDFWIQGDGGYLNWAFTGSYVRDGKKVQTQFRAMASEKGPADSFYLGHFQENVS
jgi:hypothetical protein